MVPPHMKVAALPGQLLSEFSTPHSDISSANYVFLIADIWPHKLNVLHCSQHIFMKSLNLPLQCQQFGIATWLL